MKQNKQNSLEAMRQDVLEMELKARYWKAMADIREETLRYDSLETSYNEYVERRNANLLKRQEEIEELLKAGGEVVENAEADEKE